MNKELEKLVDYALVDGYISEKEKSVLIKKAQQEGFDIDELEMILEGRQYEKTADSAPKVDKCPSCGEILKGLSKVCPSCDYVIDARSSKKKTETLDVSLDKLNDSVSSLDSIPEPGAGIAIKVAVLSFLTVGIYLIYQKLVQKYVFDKKYGDYIKVLDVINLQAQKIRQTYGEDRQTSDKLDKISVEITEKTNIRNRKTTIIGTASFVLIGLIYLGISQIPKMPESAPAKESAEERTERLIKSDSIGKAKIAAMQVESIIVREDYISQINILEIDSLTKAGDYNRAITLASKIKNGDYNHTREDKIDEIVEKETEMLIDTKDFKRARERIELASLLKKYSLEDKIDLAEKIEKDIKKKNKR